MFNPQTQSSEVSTRHMLFRQALAAALSARRRSLPPAPESWPALLRAVGKGMDGLLGRQGAREALVEIKTRLFHSPGREAESQSRWHESLATAVFGARAAELRDASVTAVFCGGLLHRSGEAFALKTLARVELEYRLKLDTPSRRDWCTTHGQELTERLVRSWALLPEIATCTLGWRRFGEFSEVSRESTALYFGRLFAIEALQPSFCVPGSIDTAAQDMGISADTVQQVRAEDVRVRELIKNLD